MFPTTQVGNFMLPGNLRVWEISDMATADDLRGKRLYDVLMKLKPDNLLEGDWASSAGVNRGFFTDLKKPTGGAPRSDTLRKLLAHVGSSEAEMYRVAAGGTPAVVSDQPVRRSVDAGETVEITQLDLSLPMGPGASVDEYVEEEPVTFDLGYVRSFSRTPAHRLRIARGVGDSMFPTLQNSDLVWIDSTLTELNQADKVWAVSINGAAAIKRLRRLKEGRVLVISDNKTIDSYEVDANEVIIWGRVIRFARDL